MDRVKPKASTRLQRERNLEADPRATLPSTIGIPGTVAVAGCARSCLEMDAGVRADCSPTSYAALPAAMRTALFVTVLVLRDPEPHRVAGPVTTARIAARLTSPPLAGHSW